MANIPGELTDRFIDFLHADRPALAACSLVCKSWVPASRYHYFRELLIEPANAQSLSELFKIITTNKVPRGTGFLNYVQSVSWKLDRDPEWITESIMCIIASVPSLSEFSVTASGHTSYLPLGQLKNLKKLSVHSNHRDVIPGIAEVIANSPELEHLDVSSCEYLEIGGTMPQLHGLVTDTLADSPPLKLQHLSVAHFHPRIDARTIPHLRSLTSLEWVIPRRIRDINGGALSFGGLWLTLKFEGVRLFRLKTSLMDDSLLEFLSSFKGLTDLRLEGLEREDDNDSDRLAKIFFQDILPHHADTLETLHIAAAYEGDWCFGKCNVTPILNCMNLRELETSVYWPRGLDLSNGAPVLFLLDSTISLLDLRLLRIRKARDPFYRHAWCGNAVSNAMRHDHALSIAICDAIGEFDPQIRNGGTSEIWMVGFRERKFEMREGEWKYIERRGCV